MPRITLTKVGEALRSEGYVQISHTYGDTPYELRMLFQAALTMDSGGATWTIAENAIWRKESECVDREKRRQKGFKSE